jgi:hypothetical protein
MMGGNHRPDWVTTYPFSAINDRWPEAAAIEGHPSTRGDVTIGNDVWIGQNATILSGVSIGHGACVAASAMVSRNVPPYAIVAENPARVVRKRFSDEQIEQLLAINWWDWSEELIRTHVADLLQTDIDAFLRVAKMVR